MEKQNICIDGIMLDVYSMNTLVVGSGCAGFNAADRLFSLGQRDVAILTEGLCMGTSRNTGSDKQTYYKLTLAGDSDDSVQDMAQTFFAGGAMHGDIALVDAALSARCFLRLVDLGVPFPHNAFGEFVGYRTDHDIRLRATSAGPLTSKYMTEGLETEVKRKGIQIFDRFLAIGILTTEEEVQPDTEPIECRLQNRLSSLHDNDKTGKQSEHQMKVPSNKPSKAIGLIALNLSDLENDAHGITLFNCTNIIYATGGPSGMYAHTVYPESQTGASGIALEAGARGINLTESQYGIASTAFRWNLSGTYQQVLPRYISTKPDGSDEKEFLNDGFTAPGKMLDAIFLKGYQWPFDPQKIRDGGSSMVDLLVWQETEKGRRVFLDYTQNPRQGCYANTNSLNFKLLEEAVCDNASRSDALDFNLLSEAAYDYLYRSAALFGRPIDRLHHMNPDAVALFRNHGIDLFKDLLEIAVCAQHNNGGLLGDIWWESNLHHFFPVGEVNGSFGIHRPGGSALNATQSGSLRAAQAIHARYNEEPLSLSDFREHVAVQVQSRVHLAKTLLGQYEQQEANNKTSDPQEIEDNPSDPQGIENKSNDPQEIEDKPTDPQEIENNPSDPQEIEYKPTDYKITTPMHVNELRQKVGRRMSRVGAHIRPIAGMAEAVCDAHFDLQKFPEQVRVANGYELADAFRLRDILITQYVYLEAIQAYMQAGGGSRGSYLICKTAFGEVQETKCLKGSAPAGLGNTILQEGMSGRLIAKDLQKNALTGLDFLEEKCELRHKVCEVVLMMEKDGANEAHCIFQWTPVRKIPERDNWFESVWRDYREGCVFNSQES